MTPIALTIAADLLAAPPRADALLCCRILTRTADGGEPVTPETWWLVALAPQPARPEPDASTQGARP